MVEVRKRTIRLKLVFIFPERVPDAGLMTMQEGGGSTETSENVEPQNSPNELTDLVGEVSGKTTYK